MRGRTVRRLKADDSGAVSTLYAVAILPLVVMAGVAFDYGRMMALDSELQNAADQAALAAATQLDGSDAAISNAENAAFNALGNTTRFANDEGGENRILTDYPDRKGIDFDYFENYDHDADVPIDPTTVAEDARYVQVTVETRSVRYALTPVMAAFSGGNARGRAIATLEEATCNVPPLMFCAPEVGGAVNPLFPTSADIGKSIKLHLKNTNGSYPWAPGDFGFLDIDYGFTGNTKTRSVGLNSQFLGCTGDAVETDPGNKDPQADAMNSRMDFFSGSVNANDCNDAGDFCPSNGVRKNMVVTETKVIRQQSGTPSAPACGDYDSRSSSWATNNSVNSFLEDNCVINGNCPVIGDGVWNYASYFSARNTYNSTYPVPTASDFGKSSMDEVTRWDVYQWELDDPGNLMRPERISSSMSGPQGNGANRRFTFTNLCAYPQPIMAPPGIEAADSQLDRRVLTVAAVDCTDLNGKAEVNILRWVELFLLATVPNTGSDKIFPAEIKGPAKLAGGESGFQYYGRKKAVLIR